MEIVPAVLTPSGIAVDTHERFMAISDARKLTVSLYSLPDCLHVRTVGCGVVTEFKEPRKMCFATNGDLLIADNTKQRVQVLSADLSIHRRNIGVGVIDGWIAGLTSNDTLIATCKSGSGRQVLHSCGLCALVPVAFLDAFTQIQMFDVETGDPVRSFCACGANFGQLNDCYGIRFMPDGLHLIVAER